MEQEQTVKIQPNWLMILIKSGILVMSLVLLVENWMTHYPISTTRLVTIFALGVIPLAIFIEEVMREKKEDFMTRLGTVMGLYGFFMFIFFFAGAFTAFGQY